MDTVIRTFGPEAAISYQLSAISKWLNAINELLLTFSPLKAKS